MSLIFVTFLAILLSLKYERTFSREYRIVNGEETQRHEFPWMAMVTIMGIQKCGATVISKQYVLSAGHCVDGSILDNISDMRIRLGAHNKTWLEDPDMQEFAVQKIILHPDHKPDFIHDFTLLELDKNANLNNNIQPICLGNADRDLTGEIATIAGWGRTSHDGLDSEVLLKAQVTVVDQKECSKKFADTGTGILDDMICAGGKGKDACQLDSGGPLMWQDDKNTWRLIGVISWGDDCGGFYYPGVYARVSSVVPWIKSVVGNDIC